MHVLIIMIVTLLMCKTGMCAWYVALSLSPFQYGEVHTDFACASLCPESGYILYPIK